MAIKHSFYFPFVYAMPKAMSRIQTGTVTRNGTEKFWKAAFRQYAALIFAVTLAWDTIKSPQSLQQFGTWSLAVHFIYFQLPRKSRALPYLHSLSFNASITMAMLYAFLLYSDPTLETRRQDSLFMSYWETITRVALFYIVPLVCHALDMFNNGLFLLHSYSAHASFKIIRAWAFAGYGLLGLVYELLYPDAGGEIEVVEQTSDLHIYLIENKLVGFFGTICSFSLLNSYILSKLNR